MIIIGFLLLAAAAVFGIDLIFANSSQTIASPNVFGQSLGITSAWTLFGIGALCGAAVLFGAVIMLGGVGRKGAKAVRHRRQRKDLEAERDAYREQAERSPDGGAPDGHRGRLAGAGSGGSSRTAGARRPRRLSLHRHA